MKIDNPMSFTEPDDPLSPNNLHRFPANIQPLIIDKSNWEKALAEGDEQAFLSTCVKELGMDEGLAQSF